MFFFLRVGILKCYGRPFSSVDIEFAKFVEMNITLTVFWMMQCNFGSRSCCARSIQDNCYYALWLSGI